MGRIEKLWTKEHDLRFFQFILCLDKTLKEKTGRTDLFNLEDNELYDLLKETFPEVFIDE